MKPLKELLYKVPLKALYGETNVAPKDFHFDSRKVQKGDLFIAIKGNQQDGHEYILKAVERGACAVICEDLPPYFSDHPSVQWIVTSNSREALAQIAANYYDNPSENLKVIGVTGTNGKTTVATLLYKLLTKLGYPCGLISTVENKIIDRALPAQLTTPDPKELQSLFHTMVQAGCEYCVMEVSSIAVHQQRVSGTRFTGGIFTNLTHDHLDYHHTFYDYLICKQAFFTMLSSKSFAISNLDDPNGEVMLQNTKARRAYYAIKRLATYNAKILESTLEGLHLILDHRELWVPLAGRFNAYNVLAVYAAARELGFRPDEILPHLTTLTSVKGRFQVYKHPKSPLYAIIDYAHTPDALKNILQTLKELKKARLIVVFGCGGNRDKDKRPQMGKIASELADKVIITSDNPRNEDPKQIIQDIYAGVAPENQSKVLTLIDREEAIITALQFAQNHDIVLIAGKGHENYQEIQQVKIPFEDSSIVQKVFNQL